MSIFELWVNACARQDGLMLYDLESEKDREETGVFMTKEEYLCNGIQYFTSPVFHVWLDGKVYVQLFPMLKPMISINVNFHQLCTISIE